MHKALKVFATQFLGWTLVTFHLVFVANGFSADLATTRHTVDGAWHFNLKNSNMANMPAPRQATLIVSIHGNWLMWRETGIDSTGRCFDEMFDGPMDGRRQSLRGTYSHVTVSFRQEYGAIVGRWKGKGKRTSIARVSVDGRSLAIENAANVYNQTSNWTTSWDKASQ
jgi:hypothetical protein